ncbi:unnamed protein product [Dibothriocephalus latus]|uniref:GIY-YIG domain-containing protein n=1 Tax=Dibothriocephalus latus TaxID=60516 RepID=A0A3P7PCN4_DIBLA|nr:unnamed protein product [Dibothriocephalus latus]
MNGIYKAISRQLSRFGISVAQKPASSLRVSLCRVKDPVPVERISDVIYRIPSAGCPCVYIDHTGRRLETRIKEHKSAVGLRYRLSLIVAYFLECDRFNLDDTDMIAMANTRQAREFLEAWHLSPASINRHVEIDSHYTGFCAWSIYLVSA